MKGKPTELDKVNEFRAHYLHSGNVSAAARAVNLPVSTAHDIAREIRKDPEFVKERKELRTRCLEDLVSMRMQMAEEASRRFHGVDEAIETIAKGGNVTVIDKRQDYGKLVLDAEKNAHNLAKLEQGADGAAQDRSGPAVVINLTKPGADDVAAG